ncbi:MAG TPA: BON domain-containing protein [Gemmatimonadaceae bacterium]
MSPIRFREEGPSFGGVIASLAAGALAGFAIGVVTAQKLGGISGIVARIGRQFPDLDDGADLHHGYGEDELEEEQLGAEALLEEDVLDAFEADPVLGERAIDIGAVGEGVIELSGWVRNDGESRRAEAVARRVAGVESVVNRLSAEDDIETHPVEEAEVDIGADETNEPRSGGHWRGQRVGTGRRRQGSSEEIDRHADPKPELGERWLDEARAMRDTAGDIEQGAERRGRGKRIPPRGDRTGGSPVAPGGVPKADHVAQPPEPGEPPAHQEPPAN